jgi:hypothetical protein
MTQEERNEEAAAVLEYEDMRAQGVSLQEIGASRAKVEKAPEDEYAKHVDTIHEENVSEKV